MRGYAWGLAAGLALVWVSASSAQQFVLTITTTDDKVIEGTVAPKDAEFEAVTEDGATVKLRLERNPDYEKQEVSETITRTEKGFVIRAPWYTAFVKSIWKAMAVQVQDNLVTVAGDQVKQVTVKWTQPKPSQPGK